MNAFFLVIGIVLVLLGARFGYRALQSYRERDEVEDAGSWVWGAALFGLLFIVLGGVLINSYLDDRRALKDARQRIAADETVITFSATGSAAGFDAEFEIANRSIFHHLISVTVEITAFDCEGPEITTRCRDVRKQELWLPADVPPQGVRTVRRTLSGVGAIDGNVLWDYRLIETVGAE